MSRMTFTNESDDGATTVVTFEAVNLQGESSVLEHFEYFLRGSGFFFDGELEILPTSEKYGNPSEERGDL